MPAHVELGGVMGGGAPVYGGLNSGQRLDTTSSAQSAQARGGDYATIAAIGADVYFTVGPNPTALASGAGMRLVLAGTYRDIGPLKEGDRIAAIDAA